MSDKASKNGMFVSMVKTKDGLTVCPDKRRAIRIGNQNLCEDRRLADEKTRLDKQGDKVGKLLDREMTTVEHFRTKVHIRAKTVPIAGLQSAFARSDTGRTRERPCTTLRKQTKSPTENDGPVGCNSKDVNSPPSSLRRGEEGEDEDDETRRLQFLSIAASIRRPSLSWEQRLGRRQEYLSRHTEKLRAKLHNKEPKPWNINYGTHVPMKKKLKPVCWTI
ncbi:Hypp2645 [Branchiostoma lanceolatum]|uniref:Hypp2645 protein n=1 Tax=Branchiostoma lanceolatum TaxID=7740 RepID=A0A8K0ER52_BRALA|nr:Hypp2645 [Branchiostoma lanceolatum]